MSIREIEAKAKELQELKRMREELDAEISTLEDAIKASMGEAEQITAGAFKITWKTITSSRFDSSAFKKANPDLAAQFIKTSTVKRFSIA
ncbi:MAG: hypothetical protein E7321_01795 [Clostridiales bacterium]|nr:hypothetical protein [Clostridiales bacterium]